jgi:RES domain-containing protein
MGADNRWNAAGQPTLYLAGDPGVALAEWARHLEIDRAARSGGAQRRRLYRMKATVDALLDLRDVATAAALGIEGYPHCFLDRDLCRATATYLRTVTPAQALLVPSVAFLDDLARWVAVLFLDKLPPEPGRFLTAVAFDRELGAGPMRAPDAGD